MIIPNGYTKEQWEEINILAKTTILSQLASTSKNSIWFCEANFYYELYRVIEKLTETKPVTKEDYRI